VWAHAEEGGRGFDPADRAHKEFTVVGKPAFQIGQWPGRALHRQYGELLEPGIGSLRHQLVGQVEVRGGEPAGNVVGARGAGLR
jgi:hypothetical protein